MQNVQQKMSGSCKIGHQYTIPMLYKWKYVLEAIKLFHILQFFPDLTISDFIPFSKKLYLKGSYFERWYTDQWDEVPAAVLTCRVLYKKGFYKWIKQWEKCSG